MPEEEIVLNGNTYRLVKGPEFHKCVETPEKAQKCQEAKEAVYWGIDWHSSDEGGDYWRLVYENLGKYAKPIKP